MILQTSMIIFHVNLQGCKTKTGKDFINNDNMMMKLQIKKGQLQIMIIVTIQAAIMTSMISMGEHRYHGIIQSVYCAILM